MAAQDEAVPTPPATLYLSSLSTANGNIDALNMQAEPDQRTLYQLQINPANPDQAALLPAPGADARLLQRFNEAVLRVFTTAKLPNDTDKYFAVQRPALLEKIGNNWKVARLGHVGFQATAPEQVMQAYGPTPPVSPTPAVTPAPELRPRIQVQWEQVGVGEKVAPLEELMRYLEGKDFKQEEALKIGRTADGKLTGSFSVSYDPSTTEAARMEGIVQGLKELGKGNGLQVFESHEQEKARQQDLVDKDPAIRIEATALKRELAADTWGTDEQLLAQLMPAAQPAITPPAPAPEAPALAAADISAPVVSPPAASATPGQPAGPAEEPLGAGELQINWKQQGAEVAPLLEMRAYFDQLKEAGVAVGALKLESDAKGKLSGSFGVSYDLASNKLGQLEATIQGLKQVGQGLEVVEKPGQAAARRQEAGYDDGYEPPRSKHVRAAFGAAQWDGLSAQLAAVPKQALTGPEQVQQAAAEQRVQQLAQQQGKTKEQVIRDGKSPFDIDTNGNPASVFLKNFYAHLNGAPRTRQSLEVDYEKTRQELQARLTRQAGSAPAQSEAAPAVRPEGPVVAVAAPVATAAAAKVAKPAQAAPALAFQASEVPQNVLASLGVTIKELAASGQLQKLLNGQKTDLIAMQVAGPAELGPVQFQGKMVLHREADGTATLKMELPQARLVIPNEIGGQPFTPEQRERLEKDGNAGLVRGLKDEKGQEYNGYVAVDKTMNRVVVLPENKVTLHETIAGVTLTPEQSHDLREGKVVPLTNMASGNGGQKFDGTVQVNAAKACIEVRPAAHELQQRQAPEVAQVVKEKVPAPAEALKVAAPQAKPRGPRH